MQNLTLIFDAQGNTALHLAVAVSPVQSLGMLPLVARKEVIFGGIDRCVVSGKHQQENGEQRALLSPIHQQENGEQRVLLCLMIPGCRLARKRG